MEQKNWIDNWTDGFLQADPETLKWLRSRPNSVKLMMLQFPPSCLVRSLIPLNCPAPGSTGIVTSYIEPSKENPNGMITVRQDPESDLRAECRPEWLEVVGYYKGLTPQVVSLLIF